MNQSIFFAERTLQKNQQKNSTYVINPTKVWSYRISFWLSVVYSQQSQNVFKIVNVIIIIIIIIIIRDFINVILLAMDDKGTCLKYLTRSLKSVILRGIQIL